MHSHAPYRVQCGNSNDYVNIFRSSYFHHLQLIKSDDEDSLGHW